MLATIKRAINFGTNGNLSDNINRRIILTNQASLIIAFGSFPFFFIFHIANAPLVANLVLPVVISFLICIGLNYFSLHRLSKLGVILFPCIAILFYSSSVGKECGIQLVCFALSAMALVVFDPEQKKEMLGAFLIPIATIFFLELTHYSLFEKIKILPIYVHLVYLSILFVTFSILFLTVQFYFISTQEAEKKLKESNQNLLNSNKNLQIAMENLTESHKLQAIMKSQTEFASLTRQIAHEIKNPMHMIRGNAEIVVDLREDQSEKIKPCLQAVVEAIDRIEKIVDAMMRYGDSQKGFSPEMITAKRLLESIAQLAMGNCKNKLIKLEVNCPEDLTFFADDKRIGQALINLLSNSLQYTPAKGQITLSAAPATYKSPHEPHEPLEGVCLFVTDTGCGIPADKIEAIFAPSITSNNAEHNFGLGLAIVFQTMTESNGLVKVESEVGKGTTFMLYLPSKPYKVEGQQGITQHQAWFAKPPETQEVYELPAKMFGDQVKKKVKS